MAGRIQRDLWEVALDQHGFVTARDARRLGINLVELGKLAARDQLDRIGYGIYRFPQLPVTELTSYMLATLWANGRGVLSHETALDLHDLCDVNPAKVHITIPAGDRYRPDRQGGEAYVVHKEKLTPEHISMHEGIRIVTPGAAIAQCIRTGTRYGLIVQAIDTATKRGAITPAEHNELTAALKDRR